MKKPLQNTGFDEMRNRTFDVVRITERLCEFCGKPMDRKGRVVKRVQISDRNDYEKLLMRAKAYDHAEVDLERNEIYFYDHDFPGDVHPSCVEKL